MTDQMSTEAFQGRTYLAQHKVHDIPKSPSAKRCYQLQSGISKYTGEELPRFCRFLVKLTVILT